LLTAVWNGRIVSESTLISRVNAARRAIGDDGEEQRLIRTVARRGVRFIGEVQEMSGPDRADRVASPTQAASPPLALPERPSIAVLPFANLSGDPEQECFADGITEDIITALSRIRQFFVVSRNSTFQFKHSSPDVRQVATALGVRYVV